VTKLISKKKSVRMMEEEEKKNSGGRGRSLDTAALLSSVCARAVVFTGCWKLPRSDENCGLVGRE